MPTSDIRICEINCKQTTYDYRTPMKFGGRVVTGVDVFDVHCEVETTQGVRAIGFGSMTMGNAWAWPSASLSSEQTLSAVEGLAERYAIEAQSCETTGHPLQLCHRLAQTLDEQAVQVIGECSLAEPMPKLAQLLATSPLEAAIFDAQGKAMGASSYSLLSKDYITQDLSHFLGDAFSGLYLDQFVSEKPRQSMPLYHLVGALDPLTVADVSDAVEDGLPETLGDWIEADGLTHLKIKLAGDDLSWDIERVAGVSRVATASCDAKTKDWNFSLDFNERCENEQYVIDLLNAIEKIEPIALQRIQYVEQPTHRNLAAFPNNTMHEVTKIRPVVIDESLIDLESLQLSRKLGYSGVALKACKGHAEALLMGAAAQHYNLFLCVQDLTCIGASFLHSASLASHIPTVAAIEGNGRQYCPIGNEGWSVRFPGMFNISNGSVQTSELSGPGLGY